VRSRNVRVAAVAVVLASVVISGPRAPRADPVVASAFDACKVERRRELAEAMKIADVEERGRRLAAIASCESDTRDVPAQVQPPFCPRGVLAAAISAGVQLPANSLVPASWIAVVELSAGLHWRRHLSFEVFGATSSFSGSTYYEIGYDPAVPVRYGYANHVYDLGLRARVHVDRLSLAFGVGVRDDHTTTIGDLVLDDSAWLVLVTAEVAMSLVSYDGVTVDAVANAGLGSNQTTNDETVGLGVRVTARL
jgi:hypothetical protein